MHDVWKKALLHVAGSLAPWNGYLQASFPSTAWLQKVQVLPHKSVRRGDRTAYCCEGSVLDMHPTPGYREREDLPYSASPLSRRSCSSKLPTPLRGTKLCVKAHENQLCSAGRIDLPALSSTNNFSRMWCTSLVQRKCFNLAEVRSRGSD